MTSIKNKLLSAATCFQKNEKGNFAIMTALSMAVLLGGMAVAIDLSNAYSHRQNLQDTTDALALMAARGELETQADLNSAAQEYMQLSFPGASVANVVVDRIDRNGDEITVVASNKVATSFGRLLGRDNIDVNASSSALFANNGVDIAMVLDTTFSMNGSKLTSLKSAANNLVDTLDTFENENLRVSVVPFAQYVNVGTSRRNANWLDVPADQVVTRQRRDVVSRTNCRTVARTTTRDGVTVNGTRRVCDVVRGPARTVTETVTWKGCVGSRLAPNHERVEFASRRIPGLLEHQAECGTEIRPLTTNLNTVKNTISSLKADGETYIPSGLAWGWRALDNNEPLTEAAITKTRTTEKVLILMTDGENQNSKNGVLHNATNRGEADRTTKSICENIKDDDIQVFTIAYEVDDRRTRNMLEGCASAGANFFNATNAAELNEAFQKIGSSLVQLRITS